MSDAGDRLRADPWAALRRLTPARIGLGRAGAAWPTREVLRFGLGHARARDAVHAPLDAGRLGEQARAQGFAPLQVHSAAPDRATYLARPDLGRRLDLASAAALAPPPGAPPEVVVALLDGLSALAVQRHALPLLRALARRSPARWSGVPLVIGLQGRVALGDEIGERLGARLVVVLLGERPGLSSPDSLGAYLTFGPRVGKSDAERNCLSNIRPEGLPPEAAALRLDWLVAAAIHRGLSGLSLKDESPAALAPLPPALP
jgi:ethanolamine ammonia-lyase small subunit